MYKVKNNHNLFTTLPHHFGQINCNDQNKEDKKNIPEIQSASDN